MMREVSQQSLDDLHNDVTAMGNLVLKRLDVVLSSLATGDETLARKVIDGDDEVNETCLTLESQYIELFTLQQPVVGDLWFISVSFKIITDREPISDLATNLGEYALAADQDLLPEVAIWEIGQEASKFVERSLDASATNDVDAGREITASDDEIDTLCQRTSEVIARNLTKCDADSDDPWAVEQLLDDVSRVLLAVRELERIGDHTVNIAARTLYMVKNNSELIY